MSSLRQTLLPAVAVAAFGAGSACRVIPDTPEFERANDTSLLQTGPYIVIDGDKNPHVMMKPRGAAYPVVQWWITSEGESAIRELVVDPPAAAKVHQVPAQPTADMWFSKLEGVPAATHISYRVRLGEQQTPTYSFRTGAPAGEGFRFAAFGDTRTGHAVHAAVVDAISSEDVDFVIHTGDMVYRGGVREMWDQFFAIERPLLVDTPMFPAVGNHDLGRRAYFERYFLLEKTAGNKRYYHYDWGNLRIIAVDGEIEGRSGSAQFGYARWALAEASARGMLTVMFLHWPPYSSGQHGSQLDIREPIAELAERYGVELVITGHDHMYERTSPIKGTTYVVSGSSGAPTRAFAPSWFTAHIRSEPHFVLVDVEEKSMTLRAVSVEGDVFDSAIILDNPIGGPADERRAEK